MPSKKASGRLLICTSCGKKHPPPRGTKCTHTSPGKAPATPQCIQNPVRVTRTHQASADTVDILSKLAELQTTQETMATRVVRLEQHGAVEGDAESVIVSRTSSRATSHARGQSRSSARSPRHRSRGHGRQRRQRRSRSSSDSSSRSSRSDSRSTRKRGLKSGLDHGPQRSVKIKVQWPTDVVFRGVSEQTIKFDDLTQNELTLGFVRLIQERADKEARKGSQPQVSRAMLDFLEQWTDDAGNYTWPTVLGYVKLVFLALERGKLSWTDPAKLQDIRDRARAKGTTIGQTRTAQAAARQSGQQTPGSASNTQKKRYCAAFNKGACNQNTPHMSDKGTVHHICAYCMNKKGKTFTHAEVDCHQKSGIFPNRPNPTKND
jgi:hypothetical protein